MAGLSESFRWAVAVLVALAAWIHSQFFRPVGEWWADTVLGTWEESIQSVVRETFATITRAVNGASAFIIARFDSSYHYSVQRAWAQQSAWQSWWNDRQSTLNAVVERLEGTQTGAGAAHTNQGHRSGGSQGETSSTATGGAEGGHHKAKEAEAARKQWERAVPAPATGPVPPIAKQIMGELFDRPAGFAISEGVKRTGLIEDLRMQIEVLVTSLFDRLKWIVRTAFGVPRQRLRRSMRGRARQNGLTSGLTAGQAPGPSPMKAQNSKEYMTMPSRSLSANLGTQTEGLRKLPRSRSLGGFEQVAATSNAHETASAGHIIKMAGYPLEVHSVMTGDGYLLTMERIPRPGAADTVFFMHGVLDTSLGWVSAGITGSQAFAAWDQGLDVWLGNTRCNPPRVHQVHSGMRFWRFTHNEVGTQDVAAQVDYIHNTKCAEMGAGSVHISLDKLGSLAPQILANHPGGQQDQLASEPSRGRLRTSHSDTNLYRASMDHAPSPPPPPSHGAAPVPSRAPSQQQHAHVTEIPEPWEPTYLSQELLGAAAPPSSPATTIGALPRHRGVRVSFYGDGDATASRSFELHAKSTDALGVAARLRATDISEGSSSGSGTQGLDDYDLVQDLDLDGSSSGPVGVANGLLAGAASMLGMARHPRPADSTPPAAAAAAAATPEAETDGRDPASRPAGGQGCGVVAEEADGGQMWTDAEGQVPSPSGGTATPGGGRWGFVSPFRVFQLLHASSGAGAAEGAEEGSQEATTATATISGEGSASMASWGLSAGEQLEGDVEGEGPPTLLQEAMDLLVVPASQGGASQEDAGSGLDANGRRWSAGGDGGVPGTPQPTGAATSASANGTPPAGPPEVDTGGPPPASLAARLSERLLALLRRPPPTPPDITPQGSLSGDTSSHGQQDGAAWTSGPLASAVEAAAASRAQAGGGGGPMDRLASWGSDDRRSSPSLPRSPGPSQQGAAGVASASTPAHNRPSPLGGQAAAAGASAQNAGSVVHSHAGSAWISSLSGGSPFRAHATSGWASSTHSGATNPPGAHAAERSGSLPAPSPSQHPQCGESHATALEAAVRRCRTATGALDDLPWEGEAAQADVPSWDRLRPSPFGQVPGGFPGFPWGASGSGGTPKAGRIRRSASSSALPEPAVAPAPGAMLGGGARGPAVAAGSRGGGEGVVAEGGPDGEPYRLRCVAHSLGGACVLMYAVMRARQGKPHHLSRIVLLTPAGFHVKFPKVAYLFIWFLPPLMWLMRLFVRSVAGALYIPTLLMRSLTFKLTLDMRRIPALLELTRLGMRLLLNGDTSQWDRALLMPHYNATSMPALSLHQLLHFTQWASRGRFCMFDYGSARLNRRHYGQSKPLDVAGEYWRIKVPVDLVAGVKDGVIPPENVRMHAAAMKAGGVTLTYREFDYGHLDFTFAAKEELRLYVLSRLMRKTAGSPQRARVAGGGM